MKYAMTIAALSVAFAMPATAQMMDKKDTKMMAPTMEQCQGGYKSSYRTSMNWTPSKFKSACRSMMMKK
jgi:uncharacterized membrane protein